jgi:hypothetical protein
MEAPMGGRYALLTTMAADMRAELDDGEIRAYLEFQLTSKLRGEGTGYRPEGEPDIEWTQITEAEADMHLAQLAELGFDDETPPPGYAAGDWRVRVITDTAPL